jgi:hypothetical protein
MKVRMAIHNLKGKANIWWQDPKLAKGYKEKRMEWSEFKKYDLINKFLDLLLFVAYINEDKVKIQRFLRCLPQSYKDKIEFDNPKSLNEVFRKARMCYDQYKQRYENPKSMEGHEVG